MTENEDLPTICQLETKEGELIDIKNEEVTRKIGLVHNFLKMDESSSLKAPIIPIKEVDAEDIKFILRHIENMLKTDNSTCDLFGECAMLTSSKFMSIIETTNFMAIPDMLKALSKFCAQQLETKNIEETAEFLGIEVDISENEREEIERNEWYKKNCK